MRRPPRKASDGIFAGGMGFNVFYQGVLISIITLAAYFIGHRMEAGVWEIAESADGITMAFLAMSMAEIFHAYNMRSHDSIFRLRTHNMLLFGTMILSLLLTSAVIFIPALSGLFGFESIDLKEYLVALALAFSIIPLVEIIKAVQRKIGKNKN